ncbi:MAG: cobyric acid synthase [Methanomassiliicoccus sp.]|nr:cobyric acid synthase [Methanomassiliicoccus sp.]
MPTSISPPARNSPGGSWIAASTPGGGSTDEYWSKVEAELRDLRAGPNLECPYYHCHYEGQDCSLCFCPLYPCLDPRLGNMVPARKGGEVWSCENCYWTHRSDVASMIAARIPPSPIPPPREFLDGIKAEVEAVHPVSAMPLMVLGATSGAGKSLITAALCRLFSDMGYNVSPFKSQNMSLNSMVTPSGGEISRAQALQAVAARTEPDSRMNPILLKPKQDDVSQVIIDGRPYRDMDVPTYYDEFTMGEGMAVVKRAWEFLRRTRDVVVIEGAGSPAEINIAAREIANMRTAEIAGAPCVLVVNMEWGGAFAYAYGTIMLLPPEQRSMFKGIILNNMHGDPTCLKEGIEELEARLGIPVLGVVPHVDHLLPDEDSQDLAKEKGAGDLKVGVIMLPRISNFTDLDALALEGVKVVYVKDPRSLEGVSAVIIPGTKNTVADLKWLRERGLFDAIRMMRGKVPILGICGGYQMLGREVIDLNGVEGDVGAIWEGLGLLDISTRFEAYEKRTIQVSGRLVSGEGDVRGYEIHMGMSESREEPLFILDEDGRKKDEGSVSKDGMVMGSYVHGLFDLPAFRQFFLSKVPLSRPRTATQDYDRSVNEGLDAVAAVVGSHLDMGRLVEILKEGLN